MERGHARRIRDQFPHREAFPPMECLDIPDDYGFMDEELVELIRAGTEAHLEAGGGG